MDRLRLTARIYDFNQAYVEPDGEDDKGEYIDRDITQLDLKNRIDGNPTAWCTSGFPYRTFILKINGLTPARVKEVAEAEKDGRLVVLPVPIGGFAYALRNGKIEKLQVMAYEGESHGSTIDPETGAIVQCIDTFGAETDKGYIYADELDILYTTREEAEAALEDQT